MEGQRCEVRGWSTLERRSSVREGTRAVIEVRFLGISVGGRRRRRSLLKEVLV